MMMWNMDSGIGMMVAMSIVWLIVVAAVVTGLVLLVRALSGRGHGGTVVRDGNAVAILDERFARGEIEREEYENRRSLLTRAR